MRELGGQRLLRTVGANEGDAVCSPFGTAVMAPGREALAFALDREARIVEQFGLADRSDPTAPPPRRAAFVAQLIAVDAQREVGLDVLDGVVPRVGEEDVYRVHAILAGAPAVGTLVDLHVDPVALPAQPAVGDDVEVANTGRDLVRARPGRAPS